MQTTACRAATLGIEAQFIQKCGTKKKKGIILAMIE